MLCALRSFAASARTERGFVGAVVGSEFDRCEGAAIESRDWKPERSACVDSRRAGSVEGAEEDAGVLDGGGISTYTDWWPTGTVTER